MNTNFIVIGLTRLEIYPESAASEVDVLISRPSELFIFQTRVVHDAGGKSSLYVLCPAYRGDYDTSCCCGQFVD